MAITAAPSRLSAATTVVETAAGATADGPSSVRGRFAGGPFAVAATAALLPSTQVARDPAQGMAVNEKTPALLSASGCKMLTSSSTSMLRLAAAALPDEAELPVGAAVSLRGIGRPVTMSIAPAAGLALAAAAGVTAASCLVGSDTDPAIAAAGRLVPATAAVDVSEATERFGPAAGPVVEVATDAGLITAATAAGAVRAAVATGAATVAALGAGGAAAQSVVDALLGSAGAAVPGLENRTPRAAAQARASASATTSAMCAPAAGCSMTGMKHWNRRSSSPRWLSTSLESGANAGTAASVAPPPLDGSSGNISKMRATSSTSVFVVALVKTVDSLCVFNRVRKRVTRSTGMERLSEAINWTASVAADGAAAEGMAAGAGVPGGAAAATALVEEPPTTGAVVV